MDASWLTLLIMAAVFIATVLLAVVCLDCGNKSPASISQTDPTEEYVPSSGFRVIHPAVTNHVPIHSPSSLMPHPNAADRGSERRLRPYTPTETESNPSYENGPDCQDSDAEDNGYIKVLPETDQSRASTPSSDNHNYVNVEEAIIKPEPESDPESEPNYLNLNEMDPPSATADILGHSEPDDDDDDDDDDDNYVNQPPMIHC